MDMRAMISLRISIVCVQIFDFVVLGEFQTFDNTWDPSDFKLKFDFFKQKYDKTYATKHEEDTAYENFVKNFNFVEKLNEKSLDPHALNTVNGMADKDPNQFEQHYAIRIRPYADENEETLRMKKEISIDKNSKNKQMYDLDNAEKLYKDFMKKYGKHAPDSKKDKQVRYLRFVKTLAEINQHNFLDNDNMTYDSTADVLDEPKEYFY